LLSLDGLCIGGGLLVTAATLLSILLPQVRQM
jgi:hypothetical protein